MQEKIVYFEKPGEENTPAVFDLVDEALAQTGIDKIVLASTRGKTAELAMDRYASTDIRLVIIPHQFGFREKREFSQETETRARNEGHVVHWGTMLFHTDKLYGSETPTLIANYLRCFCQGFKVCVELLLMAGDAGHVEQGEEVIVVAGTGKGADTAMVMTGATSMDFAKMHVSRILCKPL